jgi:hypothetical protein
MLRPPPQNPCFLPNSQSDPRPVFDGLARELVTQELGIIALIKRSVRVLTANGDDLTDSTIRRAR